MEIATQGPEVIATKVAEPEGSGSRAIKRAHA
jgi:hypothetical protein